MHLLPAQICKFVHGFPPGEHISGGGVLVGGAAAFGGDVGEFGTGCVGESVGGDVGDSVGGSVGDDAGDIVGTCEGSEVGVGACLQIF